MAAVASALQSFVRQSPRVLASHGAKVSSPSSRTSWAFSGGAYGYSTSHKSPATSYDDCFLATKCLYLQRLVTAIADIESTDLAPQVTAGNTADAYFYLRREYSTSSVNWCPALSDADGLHTVYALCQRILQAIHTFTLALGVEPLYRKEQVNVTRTHQTISPAESSQYPPPAQPIPVSPASALPRSPPSIQGLQVRSSNASRIKGPHSRFFSLILSLYSTATDTFSPKQAF